MEVLKESVSCSSLCSCEETGEMRDKRMLENCRFLDIKCFSLCPLFDRDENMCKFDIAGMYFGKVVEFVQKISKMEK